MPSWTKKEENVLLNMLRNNKRMHYATLAEVLPHSQDAIRTKAYELRKKLRHTWLEEERIGFFDIEASHLKASIGNCISWAIKPAGKKAKFCCWTRKEAIDRNRLDKRVMKELLKELANYDLLVTYFGTGFDIKFIRTRAMILGLDFPEFGELRHFDVYYAVRNKMSLHSNRLAVATQTLGIEGKTPLPPSIWSGARLGYKDSLKEVEVHNIEDVNILEELYNEILPYVQVTRKSI